MKKTVRFPAVAVCAAVFFAACTIWQPQLLRLLWASVLDVALPPLWGGLLALLLAPPYRRLCALLGGGRTARCCALVLCYTGVLGLLAGAALLLGPQLAQSILALGEHSGEYAANLRQLLEALDARLVLPQTLLPLRQELPQKLFYWLTEALNKLFPRLLGATADLLKTLLQLTLGLFFSIYFLTDGPLLAVQLKTALCVWSPQKHTDHLLQFLALCRQMILGWLCGQLLDSVLLGAACIVGMIVFRFEFPVLIGLLVCILNMIPMVGGPLGGGVGFLLLLAVHPLHAVWFMVYYLILEQLESRFLYPKIVGNRLGLPPLLVLFAILCGGELGGMLGILLALPAAAVLYAAARGATRTRHAANNKYGENQT
jgi:predicted PurR-regulated permease PerM